LPQEKALIPENGKGKATPAQKFKNQQAVAQRETHLSGH